MVQISFKLSILYFQISHDGTFKDIRDKAIRSFRKFPECLRLPQSVLDGTLLLKGLNGPVLDETTVCWPSTVFVYVEVRNAKSDFLITPVLKLFPGQNTAMQDMQEYFVIDIYCL